MPTSRAIPGAYKTRFVIGRSATRQISHTKGFVADGRVAAEGSTNWSTTGEGTFVVTGKPGGAGYVAQNNTQSVISDADTINRFQAELIAEHLAARAQAPASAAAAPVKAAAGPVAKASSARAARVAPAASPGRAAT